MTDCKRKEYLKKYYEINKILANLAEKQKYRKIKLRRVNKLPSKVCVGHFLDSPGKTLRDMQNVAKKITFLENLKDYLWLKINKGIRCDDKYNRIKDKNKDFKKLLKVLKYAKKMNQRIIINSNKEVTVYMYHILKLIKIS